MTLSSDAIAIGAHCFVPRSESCKTCKPCKKRAAETSRNHCGNADFARFARFLPMSSHVRAQDIALDIGIARAGGGDGKPCKSCKSCRGRIS